MSRTLRRLIVDEDGQAVLEYGLVIIIIAVGLVSLVAELGNPIRALLESAVVNPPVDWSP